MSVSDKLLFYANNKNLRGAVQNCRPALNVNCLGYRKICELNEALVVCGQSARRDHFRTGFGAGWPA